MSNTGDNQKKLIKRAWEYWYPTLGGAVVGGLCIFYGSQLYQYAYCNHVDLKNLYPNLLSFASITTGFLATFYTTLFSSSGGLIARIRRSIYFFRFIGYMKYAIIAGLCFSVLALYIATITPTLTPETGLLTLCVTSIWYGLGATVLLSFYRVVRLFFVIFDPTIKSRSPAR